MGIFRRPFHRGPRSRRRQVVATYAVAPAAVSTVVRRRKVPDHVYRRPDLSIYSRTWRRALMVPTYVAPLVKPIERRPVPPHVYDRPDMTEFSRRRRRLAPRRVVAATVAEACRLQLAGVERAVIVMAATTPDADYIDNGREPFLLPGVWCREDV